MGIFSGKTIQTVQAEPSELIESARADHPEVVAELERLQQWCAVCLGDDVARWNGLTVDN